MILIDFECLDKGVPYAKFKGKMLPLPGVLPGMRIDLSGQFVIINIDNIGLTLKWDTEVSILHDF